MICKWTRPQPASIPSCLSTAKKDDTESMPCLIALLMLAFPRVAIVLLWLFTSFFERAYHSILLLALGFVFLPLTTIVYAWVINSGHSPEGVYLVAVIVAVLADVGMLGGGEYHRRRR